MTASHTISNSVATDTGGEDGTISGALRMNPIQPVYEDELTGAYTQINVPGILVPNPVATAKNGNLIMRLHVCLEIFMHNGRSFRI